MSASDWIHVRGLRLWAHVGVLDGERAEGQWFELEFWLAGDLAGAARRDELAASFDYAIAITALQRQAREVCCLTIEHYSELVLDCLEALYGLVPLRLDLVKCHAPVNGFGGRVGVRRHRRWTATAASC